MKSIDLDIIKAAWGKESGFENKSLSKADIENFLSGKSKDVSLLFRKGLAFDIVLKSIIGASFLGIIILFKNEQSVILISLAILLVIIWTIRYQWLMIGKVPEAGIRDRTVRTTLENKINFYRQRYIKSLYVGGLSNSLLVLAGMIYYFYFKYGEVRPFQWDDYLVSGIAIILSFAIGVLAQIKQSSFQVKQLEGCLREIDEDAISTLTLRDQRNKKRRMILIFLLALLCGLLVLAILIFR
jgi:hypothetical protein